MAETQYYGTGKRKSAIARVFLRPGAGTIQVNKKSPEDYFNTDTQLAAILEPLHVVGAVGKYDLYVTVCGGGISGQAAAVRHGIARALLDADPEHRGVLKQQGMLTRDARKKERKKYGQRGARARFQFSKR